MNNKKYIVILSVFGVMLLSHIFLFVQTIFLNGSVSALEKKTEELEKTLVDFQSHMDLQVTQIHEELESINKKTDMQFSRTVGMSRTYDALLVEQKKKTVDTTSQDQAVEKIRRDAKKHFAEKKYSLAYTEFQKVLSYQNDDMESRLNKVKSLYYKNRADSSKYTEILEDIGILKANGHLDGEASRIEKLVIAEREGLND